MNVTRKDRFRLILSDGSQARRIFASERQIDALKEQLDRGIPIDQCMMPRDVGLFCDTGWEETDSNESAGV